MSTPKEISKRIKAKGLQKLRWYCQMCEKQCRDENGFKCHIKSEGHLRAMRVFAENPNSVIDDFSQQFLKGFMDTLSRRHGTKRILANRVYQEYIADKNHIHMNATCWSSLTGLCKHLGKEGMCVVDETEKGWFVQYIDRDPKLRAKQEAMESRQIAELDEQERVQLAIEAQREAARRALGIDSDAESAEGATELMKDDADAPLSLTLSFSSAVGGGGVASKRTLGAMDGSGEGGAAGAAAAGPSLKRIAAVFGDDEEDDIPKGTTTRDSKTSTASAAAVSASSHHASGGSAVSALESIRQDEERRKQALLAAEESRNRRDYWLHPGIVVKVLNKKVSDGKYYKLKADVVRVIDDYVGEVKVHNLNSILQLDQQDLETVIPKVGGVAMVVNGRGRGCRGTVTRIKEDKYTCDIKMTEGVLAGREIFDVEYEDVCKVCDV